MDRPGCGVGRRFRRGRKTGGTRAVSDVVATILLLALTVTLFAGIFAFVSAFPPPPPQNSNQFQAKLVPTSSGSNVALITILHLAGPSVPVSALIYFKSSNYPSEAELLTPYSVAFGLPTGATAWSLGQTWVLNFTQHSLAQPALPDNITVYITTPTQLLFSVVLPGLTIATPPAFVSSGTVPANPQAQGAKFEVVAAVTGSLGTARVYVNLGGIPGQSATAQKMWFNSSSGQWQFNVTAGNTTTTPGGTYLAVLNVTNSAGQSATTTATVTITTSSGGGGAAQLSVAVVMIPQPPTLPTNASYFAAVVTYTGTKSNLALTVSFFVNQSLNPPFGTIAKVFAGQSGLTISGPSTVTVYSTPQPTFSNWTLNSSVVVQASATVSGVGSSTGTTSFHTTNLVQGITWSTSTNVASSCRTSGTSCPTIYWEVWDNWTVNPNAISVSGTEYANLSGGASTHWSIGATSVSSGSNTGPVDPLGGSTAWRPTTAGTYTIWVVLTITYKAVIVGYISDTYLPITVH